MAKRNLIVVRCGSKSLHPHWLKGAEPEFDILLCPYEEIDAQGLPVLEAPPAYKWTALHAALTANPVWRSYDYVSFPDDDLLADAHRWNTLFAMSAKLGARLSAPALTPESFVSHLVTLENLSFAARSTTFVEVMTPCFAREFLVEALPTFGLSRAGWGFGLDFLWPAMLSYRDVWTIDAAAVRHTRPIGLARGGAAALNSRDLAFVLRLGAPVARHSMAGWTRDGTWLDLEDSRLAALLQSGVAYAEHAHANLWTDARNRLLGPAPALPADFASRLKGAVDHFYAPSPAVSRGKPARASSVSPWSWTSDAALEASAANDGLLTGVCGFHTEREVNPWWEVDLGTTYRLEGFAIYNRLDQRERFTDFDVLASLDGQSWKAAFARRDQHLFGGADGDPFRGRFDSPVEARYVRVQLVGFNYLHLDQVEIFGAPLESPDPDIDDAKWLAESLAAFERLLGDPRGRCLLEGFYRRLKSLDFAA
jgi:hypothetical protein